MKRVRFVGLDVHEETIDVAVVDSVGGNEDEGRVCTHQEEMMVQGDSDRTTS